MSKKSYIMILSVILILSVLITGINVVNISEVSYIKANTTSIEEMNVIIDCGHGGEDGGAVSSDGIVEKDINLAIGLILEKFFLQGGFNVTMTRREDISLHDETAESLREKKVSDIHNRTDFCNSSDNNILISIHQNKFDDSKYYGTQVFYSKNNTQSRVLAESIRASVTGLLQNDNTRQCKEATNSIYLLHNAKIPAVIVECGFLSNPQETELLKSEMYQREIAYAIYCGFLEFYYKSDLVQSQQKY